MAACNYCSALFLLVYLLEWHGKHPPHMVIYIRCLQSQSAKFHLEREKREVQYVLVWIMCLGEAASGHVTTHCNNAARILASQQLPT